LKIALVIASDRSFRGERDDLTGPLVIEYLKKDKNEVFYQIIPDEKDIIKQTLLDFVGKNVNLILTSGGTGFAKRDVTPEATKEVIEKEAPGIAEYMRAENAKNSKNSFLSRGICGIKNETLIINLPGSPNGALECYKIVEPLLNHAIQLLTNSIKDCKMA